MKTASFFFTVFYEKRKLADFPYARMDVTDKAISSTLPVLWYAGSATSGAPHPCVASFKNSSTKNSNSDMC